VENHPQITQFIPRKYQSYAWGLSLAAVAIAAIELLHVWAAEIAAAIGSVPIAAIDLDAGGGLASWLAAVLLAGVAVVAWVVYSLRRHRVDDYRARYRLWLWVLAAALVASADSVANLHQPWMSLWITLTGWSAFEGNIWWLAPVSVGAVWIGARLLAETAECRGACGLGLASLLAYVLALVAALGVLPAELAQGAAVVVSSALLAGHAVLLAAVTLYARFVVLDVQGLITPAAGGSCLSAPSQPVSRRKSSTAGAAVTQLEAAPATLSLDPQPRRDGKASPGKGSPAAARQSDPVTWVDGSAPHEEAYEEETAQTHKLSKAERKRLRKERRKCA
jgi:hypothetical protein